MQIIFIIIYLFFKCRFVSVYTKMTIWGMRNISSSELKRVLLSHLFLDRDRINGTGWNATHTGDALLHF
jgi:hypothetical protein